MFSFTLVLGLGAIALFCFYRKQTPAKSGEDQRIVWEVLRRFEKNTQWKGPEEVIAQQIYDCFWSHPDEFGSDAILWDLAERNLRKAYPQEIAKQKIKRIIQLYEHLDA